GVFWQGTSGQNLQNVRVSNTTFSGFGGALQGQGIEGLEIDHNKFLSPRGHDESKFGTNPAVYVWLFENSNGICRNVRVHHNFADGYTRSGPLSSTVSQRAMDGFFLGYTYGLDIYKNETRNFIEEHYIILHPVMFPQTETVTRLHKNTMHASLIAGSKLDDGTAKKNNYGIRSDASHVIMESNVISNF